MEGVRHQPAFGSNPAGTALLPFDDELIENLERRSPLDILGGDEHDHATEPVGPHVGAGEGRQHVEIAQCL